MKKYFILYRPFLKFLGLFFGTYLLLTFFYQLYLNQYDTKKFEIDKITEFVAKQSAYLMTMFDSNSYAKTSSTESSLKLLYKNNVVSRVIEGCNAVSIIILFTSFIIAFSAKWKQTLLFIIFGSILIHLCNIVRIAILSVLFYEYPQYKNVLHGVIFPIIIYGVVFILWIVWINKFSLYGKKDSNY